MKTLRMKNSTLGVKITIIAFSVLFIANVVFNFYPVFFAAMNTFKTAAEYDESIMALPSLSNFELKNYIRIFTAFSEGLGFTYLDLLGNTLWIMVVNTFCELVSSILLAYALAKFRFPGSNFLYWLVIFSQTIPIIGAGAASYMLRVKLNMINNPWLIWISWLSAFDFTFIIFYGTFKGVSNSYSEAAKIDGATNIFILFKIMVPQVFPIIVANAITAAVGIWNNYSISMIYLRSYPTLGYGMYLIDKEIYLLEGGRPVYFACAIVSALPMVVIYASNLNLILQNMTVGGLKG